MLCCCHPAWPPPSPYSLDERIKEALPGTKEHKAKKAEEGNLAVYS
jgi:hypothetical protein